MICLTEKHKENQEKSLAEINRMVDKYMFLSSYIDKEEMLEELLSIYQSGKNDAIEMCLDVISQEDKNVKK